MTMTRKIRADLLLLGIAFIWGATFALVKDALHDIPPFLYTLIRFALAAALFAALFRKRLRGLTPGAVRAGVICGIFLGIGYGAQTFGLTMTSASRSAFITGLSVAIVPLLAPVMHGAMPPMRTFWGPLTALVGLYLVTTGGPAIPLNWGDFWTFVCALAFAAHLLCVERYTRQYDYIGLTFLQLAVCACVSIPPSLALESWSFTVSGRVIIALITTVLLASVLAFYILNRVQRHTTAVHAAVIFTMEPVFAGLVAFMFYGERWGLEGLIGAACILAGMLISTFLYEPEIALEELLQMSIPEAGKENNEEER